jgi:hypothetical protein
MAWAPTTRDVAEMTRGYSPKGSERFVELPYHSDSALVVIQRKEYDAGGGEIPTTIPSLLLPPNKMRLFGVASVEENGKCSVGYYIFIR